MSRVNTSFWPAPLNSQQTTNQSAPTTKIHTRQARGVKSSRPSDLLCGIGARRAMMSTNAHNMTACYGCRRAPTVLPLKNGPGENRTHTCRLSADCSTFEPRVQRRPRPRFSVFKDLHRSETGLGPGGIEPPSRSADLQSAEPTTLLNDPKNEKRRRGLSQAASRSLSVSCSLAAWHS